MGQHGQGGLIGTIMITVLIVVISQIIIIKLLS